MIRFYSLLMAISMGMGLMHSAPIAAVEKKVPVTITGGHETDPRDGGRPVVLIAAGLDVKPEVFREAFKGVKPARDGKPSPEEARRNKSALMKALKPHGVTNDRLDEVSNYYRYRPQKGELWTTAAAKAHAVVVDGQIKEIVVTEPGSGFSSAPQITIKGFKDLKFQATLQFSKELKKNGSIDSIRVVKD
jgi:hypothetical protein